jgi:PAS domain-containing protein
MTLLRRLWNRLRGDTAREAPPLSRLLASILLVTLVPSAALSFGLVWWGYRSDVAALEEATLASARGLAASMDRYVAQLRTGLDALATSPTLDEQDLPGFRRQADEFVQSTGLVLNIVLLGADGTPLANTAQRPHGPQTGLAPGRPAVQPLAELQAGAPVAVSDLYASPVTGVPAVAVGVARRSAGQVTHAVTAGVGAARLAEVVEAAQLPAGWSGTLVDRQGVVVARVPRRDDLVGTQVNTPLANAMRVAPQGVLAYTTRDGRPVRAAFARTQAGFHMVVSVPEAALVGPLRRDLAFVTIALAAVVASALAVAYGVARRITSSVAALAEAAANVRRGHVAGARRLSFREADRVRLGLNMAAAELQQASSDLDFVQRELAGRNADQLAGLLEAVADPMLVADGEMTVRAVNTAAARLFGGRRRDLLGKPMNDLVRPAAGHGGVAEAAADTPVVAVRLDGTQQRVSVRSALGGMGSNRFFAVSLRALGD